MKPRNTTTTLPCLSDGKILPKLIVFDLDYTLWPYWIDTHITPPIKATCQPDIIQDATGEEYAFYEDVPSILMAMKNRGLKIAIASRTTTPDLGFQMLNLLKIKTKDGKNRKAIDFFDYQTIYPGDKIAHFKELEISTGVNFRDMLFFDDEPRNRNVEKLGVTMHLVEDGINFFVFENGIKEWRVRRGTGDQS